MYEIGFQLSPVAKYLERNKTLRLRVLEHPCYISDLRRIGADVERDRAMIGLLALFSTQGPRARFFAVVLFVSTPSLLINIPATSLLLSISSICTRIGGPHSPAEVRGGRSQ